MTSMITACRSASSTCATQCCVRFSRLELDVQGLRVDGNEHCVDYATIDNDRLEVLNR